MARVTAPVNTSAVDVARYLVELANADEEHEEFVGHLRLHKLLYYVQGWSLALNGRAMFREQIQAWSHGPVVPAVFRLLRDKRYQPIKPDDLPTAEPLSAADRRFVSRVWDTYKPYSASQLRTMTHEESPWMDARGDLDPAAASSAVITVPSMREFFTKRAA
jgi:uncharacterized phage-associated protein